MDEKGKHVVHTQDSAGNPKDVEIRTAKDRDEIRGVTRVGGKSPGPVKIVDKTGGSK